MRNDLDLGVLAASQAGYVGHDQAVEYGLTESSIRWRVTNGAWHPVRRGLYRIDGLGGDNKGLLRAATALLPDAVVSHESAAEAHKVPNVPRGMATVTVNTATTHDFPGVTVHRSLDLFAHHRMIVEGLPTTTVARTLVDLTAKLSPKWMAHVLDEALAARLTGIDDVNDVFHDVARPGRTGSKLCRELLATRLGSDTVTATRLERVGMRVFERGGLVRPEFQFPAPWDPTRSIDFAWPWCRVGCECDSKRWHTRVRDFQTDRSRDNRALDFGWRIYRFTWDDFVRRPHEIVAQLRSALAA